MSRGQLHIGWSQIEITPPKKTLLQGQFHARLAETAISPLTATALAVETRALDDSLEQAIFLSCDLVAEGFKSDLLAKLAGRCRGFDINKLTINATHTHNAPPVQSGMYEEPKDDPDFTTPDAYRGFLVDRLADVMESAWEDRQPGKPVDWDVRLLDAHGRRYHFTRIRCLQIRWQAVQDVHDKGRIGQQWGDSDLRG